MNISKQYLAGFIDGEGNINLGKMPDKRLKKGWTVRYQVRVTGQCKEIIERIQQEYGGCIQIKKNQKECYQLEINKKEGIYNLLKDILPYLIIKKSQAKRLYLFVKNRLNTHKKLTDKELDKL